MTFGTAMKKLVKEPDAKVKLTGWSHGTYCYMRTPHTLVYCIDTNNNANGPYIPHAADITGVWETHK